MKTKSAAEYMVLIALCLAVGCIIYRQHGTLPTPVYAAAPSLALATDAPSQKPVSVPITSQERQVIRDYVSLRSDRGKLKKALPPGLARKAGSLTPESRKKLVKGQTMSAELYRECHPLPKELQTRLPSAPLGTTMVAVDGKIVRLARVSLEILDVFEIQP